MDRRKGKGKWYFNDHKVEKLLGKGRVTFQGKTNKYTRRVTISHKAFRKLGDVTINPIGQIIGI